MSEIDKILEEIDRKPAKRPWNYTWLAIVFADLIFALLDAGSGIGVAYLTGVPYYGVIVFFAGIIPLILWQKLYTHAYANDNQKIAAGIGAVVAVISVIIVAGTVAVVRFLVDGIWVEIGLAVVLVLFTTVHGLLAGYYYYVDEGIIATQKATQLVGNAVRKIQRVKVGEMVLDATQRTVAEKQRVANRYSEEAVRKVMGEDSPNE